MVKPDSKRCIGSAPTMRCGLAQVVGMHEAHDKKSKMPGRFDAWENGNLGHFDS